MFLYQESHKYVHFKYSLFRGKQWDQQTAVVLLPPGMQTERIASVSHLPAAKHIKHLIHCTMNLKMHFVRGDAHVNMCQQ